MKNKIETPLFNTIVEERELNEINGGSTFKDVYEYVVKVIKPNDKEKK
jgi:hypothetical protein